MTARRINVTVKAIRMTVMPIDHKVNARSHHANTHDRDQRRIAQRLWLHRLHPRTHIASLSRSLSKSDSQRGRNLFKCCNLIAACGSKRVIAKRSFARAR